MQSIHLSQYSVFLNQQDIRIHITQLWIYCSVDCSCNAFSNDHWWAVLRSLFRKRNWNSAFEILKSVMFKCILNFTDLINFTFMLIRQAHATWLRIKTYICPHISTNPFAYILDHKILLLPSVLWYYCKANGTVCVKAAQRGKNNNLSKALGVGSSLLNLTNWTKVNLNLKSAKLH